MDLFERDLRDELRRTALAAPATLSLDAVYGRARRMQREQTTRVTLACVGTAAAVGWGMYAANARPTGASRLDPAGSPTAPPTAGPRAADSPSVEPTPTPTEWASPTDEPAPATSEVPIAEIPEEGSADPFDPAVPLATNGPEVPDVTTSQHPDPAVEGGVVIEVKAYDADGWIREIRFDYDDATNPAGTSSTSPFDCDPENTNGPGGTRYGALRSFHYLTPGDHEVFVTVTSGNCDDPVTGVQTVTTTVVVTTGTPAPSPRKDLS